MKLCPTLRPHGRWPARVFCPWNSPGENTGVGCHFLLQGIFLTQESNLCFLHLFQWQMSSLPLCYLGSPTGSLQQQKCILSQCWKIEVWNQVSAVLVPSGVSDKEAVQVCLLDFDYCQKFLNVLLHVDSSLYLLPPPQHGILFVCICMFPLLIKTPSHWIWGHLNPIWSHLASVTSAKTQLLVYIHKYQRLTL